MIRFRHLINDNIAVEAWGVADKFGHRVRTASGKVASVYAQLYALGGQYHFGGADRIVRPFVGLGYHESNYDGGTAQPGGARSRPPLSTSTSTRPGSHAPTCATCRASRT